MQNLLDNPNDVGMLSLGLRLLSTPGKFGQALGTAGLGAMGDMQQAKQAQAMAQQRMLQQEMQRMQVEQIKRQQAEQEQQRQRQMRVENAYRGAMETPAQQALAQGGGPTVANAQAMQGMAPRFNQQKLIASLMAEDPIMAAQMMTPKPADYKVVGDSLVAIGGDGVKEAYRAPAKPEAAPSSVREFEYAQQRPEFGEFLLRNKKAGATNIGLKVENKMGDSLAGQVGPMLKDSRVATDGAVKMFDAADRIGKALDSNKVSAGPLASKIQTVRQFAQVVGGGNDESIRQTRQVIKSLAQMSVEARKQLQGQGQVTESEAAAVAKADAGDINDLTTGELRDLVTLTKRAAHFQAQSHNKLLETMAGSDVTRPVVPFYQVRGTDALLKHSPQLPQIGGAPNVDSLVEKYRTK